MAIAALTGTSFTQPVAQLRKATVAPTKVLPFLTLTDLPSIANIAEEIVLLASSGRSVACKSKRWPGKNRAMMGAAWLLVNSSLGGVSRDTAGAASAAPVAITVSMAVVSLLNKKVARLGMGAPGSGG